MADNRVSFPIQSDDVVAVRLTALSGLLTTLNPNLTAGDVFIAEVAAESNVAIFIAGATAPDTTEPNLLDIPDDGIPSGDYEVKTANTKTGTLWDWDEQSEVSNISIINQDLKEIFDLYVAVANVYNALDKEASGYVLDARQGKALSDLIDLKVAIADLASTANEKGASLVGVEDADGNYDETTVEAVLAEIAETIADIAPDMSAYTISVNHAMRNAFIDFYMSLVSETTISYGIGGYFLIEYFFKNAAGFPAGMTTEWTWDTSTIEGWGYTVLTVASTQSLIPIPKPDSDDVLYSGGDEDECTIVYHVRYVNAWTQTDWSDNKVISSFDPPDDGSNFVENLLTGARANEFAADIGGQLAANAVFSSKVAAQQSRALQGSGTPVSTIVPDYIGQMYVDTTNFKVYFATGSAAADWAEGASKT